MPFSKIRLNMERRVDISSIMTLVYMRRRYGFGHGYGFLVFFLAGVVAVNHEHYHPG